MYIHIYFLSAKYIGNVFLFAHRNILLYMITFMERFICGKKKRFYFMLKELTHFRRYFFNMRTQIVHTNKRLYSCIRINVLKNTSDSLYLVP